MLSIFLDIVLINSILKIMFNGLRLVCDVNKTSHKHRLNSHDDSKQRKQ